MIICQILRMTTMTLAIKTFISPKQLSFRTTFGSTKLSFSLSTIQLHHIMWFNYVEILLAAGLFGTLTNGQTSKCYCLSTSTNGCFPSTTVMKSTFGNSFMTILPYGAPCHDPYYNAQECSLRQAGQHVSDALLSAIYLKNIEQHV